jgi:hypothetical protein
MTYFPKVKPGQRAFRKQLMPTIPVELIAAATDVVNGKLQTISVTGGCATVARAHEEGIVATVRFYTGVGRICGMAQMLKSQRIDGVTKQPFRFLGLEQDDYRRLKAILAMN